MIETDKLMNLGDGKLLYDDLRGRIEEVLPDGGSTGQVLTKNSSADYDVKWSTPSGGGGGAIIDDNAGEGDTDVTWSANKIYGEFELQVGNINALLATI